MSTILRCKLKILLDIEPKNNSCLRIDFGVEKIWRGNTPFGRGRLNTKCDSIPPNEKSGLFIRSDFVAILSKPRISISGGK